MTPDREKLRQLAESVALPWAYRPYEHDDWGYIRGPEKVSEMIGPYKPVVANSRQSDVSEEQMAEHRAAKTDPYEPVGRLIVAAVNALPSLLDDMERVEADALMYREYHDRAVGDRDIALGLLRDVIVAAGGIAKPGCTVDFLRYAPKEVAAIKAERDRLKADLAEAREALLRIAVEDRHCRKVKPNPDGGIRGHGSMIAVYALTGKNGSFLTDDDVRAASVHSRLSGEGE